MKVVLDCGHGGTDPGAVYGNLFEKHICLAIGLLTRSRLRDLGHQVMMTRETDEFVAISQRARLANQWNAHALVSIHTNADPDEDKPGMKEAKGTEIWIYPGSIKGRELANCIANQMRHYIPQRPWRGIKEEEFGILRLTNMPAVLVEVGFIDTEESYKLNEPQTQMMAANILCEGINCYDRQNTYFV